MTDPTTVEVAEANAILEGYGPLATFPWHDQQDWALRASTDTVVVLGGNQSGKTTVGAGIVSRLVRREGPIYKRLRNADTRPLKIWVSPQLHEKYLSNWEEKLKHQVFAGMEYDYHETPHPVFTWDDACAKGNTIWGKSQEQGFLAFESDVVDLIVFDEEPDDPRLYSSAKQRVATTNGVIVFTFTPLMGLSWSYGPFYEATCRPEHQVKGAPRVWRRDADLTVVQMGMADNPAAVAGGGVERLKNDPAISESERQARLYGTYGYAEGLIFPEFADLKVGAVRPGPYIIPELPHGRVLSWVLVADPNKRHAAMLCAVDHEGNRFYVDEHYREGIPDRLHAEGYRRMLWRWRTRIAPSVQLGADTLEQTDPGRYREALATLVRLVNGYADPGGAGAQAILNIADVGIFLQPVKKDAGSVKASIEALRRAAWVDPNHRHPYTGEMGAPYVFFLATLVSDWELDGVTFHESRIMWELRQYRQKDKSPPDTPVKEKDDCVDCARYVELVRPFTPAPVTDPQAEAREKLDALSRKAAREYDDLVTKATRPAPQGEVL